METQLAKLFQLYGQMAIRAVLLEEENAQLKAELARRQGGASDGDDHPEGGAPS